MSVGSKSKSISGNAGKDADNQATIAPHTIVSQFGTLQSQEKKLISNENASTVSKKQNRQKDSGTISKNQSP